MSTEGINGTSQMWARALIRQSPGSSAQGRLSAGAWDRKDHPHAELWAPVGDGADPPRWLTAAQFTSFLGTQRAARAQTH